MKLFLLLKHFNYIKLRFSDFCLTGVIICEDVEVYISCELSLSSLTGSAGIVGLFSFWFYQFVSFHLKMLDLVI